MGNVGSFLFYLGLFSVSIFCFYKSSKSKDSLIRRGYAAIGLLIPILTATLRYQVGVDYVSYVESAIELSSVALADFFSGKVTYFEPSMYIISKLTFASENHATLFFGAYAAITSLFFYLAAKRYNPRYWWVIMALYLLVLFSPSLNAVRQFASVAIVFFASTYIIQSDRRSWLKFYVWMTVAYLFHSSAIIASVLLPLLWFTSRHDNKSTRMWLLVKYAAVASIIYLFLYNFFYLVPQVSILEKYATFIHDANVLANHPPNPIVKAAPILVSFIFFKRILKLDSNFTFYYLILFIALALSLSGSFIPQGYRLADYFTPFYFIIFASILDTTKLNKRVLIFGIFVYSIGYFTYSTFINNSYMTFPYRSILEVWL